MSKYATMTTDFDRQKNAQAALYTGAIAGVLLLLVWFVKFYQPVVPPPVADEYVEINLPEPPPVEDVNLGNNDVGSGNVQPIVTGTPSSAPVSQDVAPSRGETTQQSTKDFDEDNEREAPPITKPAKPNPTAKETNNNASDQSAASNTPQLRRGAQMTSVRGSGNGGNTDALGYNKPGSQGPGDGPGDKGTFNGNPKGTNFGTRKAAPIFNKDFKGDFNQNAVVAVLVEVNANGKVTKANYTSKGSSGTATGDMKREAERRAFEVDFVATGSPQKGILQFDFRVS
jgi:periplasmic protein TonB